jgi:thiosulfate reductase cytochrome b subunit
MGEAVPTMGEAVPTMGEAVPTMGGAVPSGGVHARHTAADRLPTASSAETPRDGARPDLATTDEAATATAPGVSAPGQRRGLPRVPGGEPWPPASARRAAAQPVPNAAPAASVDPAALTGPRPPLRVRRTVFPTASSERWSALRAERLGHERQPAIAEPRRLGFTVLGMIALAVTAGMVVLFTRWLVSTPPLEAFFAAYPGEYPPPDTAPVGLPAWLGWQHFLNAFFLVLIVRSGVQVRHQTRPLAFWSPRRDPKRRISLTLWFHQALDVLWVVNGVLFVVLLCATGQWMRIVPTSWEVLPNAISAALQYVSLDWPTENGWVNYNALQQLSYFAITFVAAPLAIVSGIRMSSVWPRDSARLNRAYPIEWARAVHYPVMLFFVAFTVVHVGLVLATGARRNLNHMYAAQDGAGWLGIVLFAASLAVIAAAWIAARPLVLAPIARLFGDVATR